MKEFEELETRRIQKLLVRQGETEVWISGGSFYKNMRPNEVEAYQQILPFRNQLYEEANILIPHFYGQASSQELRALKEAYRDALRSDKLYKISLLDEIRHKTLGESYGLGIDKNGNDFMFIFESLSAFREIIKPKGLIFAEDYESRPIALLKESRGIVERFLKVDSGRLIRQVQESSNQFGDTVLVAAHRDLNWNNISLTKVKGRDKVVLQITDWGSFGMVYEGYDEGRLFTRLCLDEATQDIYLESLQKFLNLQLPVKEIKPFLLSFWRTAAIRSYREIYLTFNGRYDRLMSDDPTFRDIFIRSFKSMLDMSIRNLTSLMSC